MMNERRKRDKEKTIEDILTAARKLFSERGLHGTSIRDIENESGVSKGLILHHFNTKEALYAAVQDQLNQEYIDMMVSHKQASKDLKELISTTIQNSFSHLKKNKQYRRISLWSYLEGHERTTELEKRFTVALVEAMRSGQQSGLVVDDIDAFLMPFIIKGTIEYWIRRQNLIQGLINDGEVFAQDYDEHLVDALTRLFLK